MASLDALLAASDVVTLHVPGLTSTHRLIAAEQIRRMPEGFYLINASRGRVVDLDDLAAALRNGHLAGAAIDVFPNEPKNAADPFRSPLQGLDNVILTPHVAASTSEAQARIGHEVAARLVDYWDVGRTTGAVNFPSVDLPLRPDGTRYLHVHRNAPGCLAAVTSVFSSNVCNIRAQYL